ncbi:MULTISPECIES: hypothetical protein [unclassified Pseudofrankia]|uniref:hypothetical protein n=1 Tax=unclassified Pseudofrankia TaxID=2994372 RepID=UPI00104282BE|nr:MULTISPECIES: hypothetical protein [unclassified Pseudofrankia]MDT3439957.1 hypothetical protein [Pseudofrankia sp. BMG5.37]
MTARQQTDIHWNVRPVIRASALALALAVAAGVLTGCRVTGLVFTGGQIRITSPGASSTVSELPMKITWTAGSLARPGDQFAVFLDQPTIRPGQNVLKLVPESCRNLPTCSREQFLKQVKVWITKSPALVLDSIPRANPIGNDREYHSVTVVVVDKSLKRVGEQFASIDFIYQRGVIDF